MHSGDTLACFVHAFGITTGTISVADPTNGTYSAVDGPSNIAGARSATFYEKNISASAVVITATLEPPTRNGQSCVRVRQREYHGTPRSTQPGGGDGGYGRVITGTSVTTGFANEGLFGAVLCANSCLIGGPGSGPVQPWTIGSGDAFDNISMYLSSGAIGSFTVQALDSGGPGSADLAAIMTFNQ